ncbi:MAG: hypothetical protein A2161_02000 [Candidatus Schekmanbacteria bacterium RBG_13_48_7]|uniref:DUF4258 domain-containing protein n=1 Tax=Candidatus Schekmanbacteria bacterium RBG_13_48_7 TaxID=1817878 RepID=A0A1F7S230_9BACT|nr:MAG: hypothetical protein A2161_02000 [Candidatus Schekmanbacteria bacterium RBG_13_48_7]
MTKINKYKISDHALLEMQRRQITRSEIKRILASPEQYEIIRPGRMVFQSRIKFSEPPKNYLLRVFNDVDRDTPEVITAYRTSNIEKYWRTKI